ncbi:tube protein [Pseudanabaena phage Pam3]|uniref:Tube protein n=1 Tax=Pseudanabaena phage Pam3 TaxID=2936519 RepID=A0ACD6BAM9_9CAUD|nr:Chain 1, pam3 tube protein [uncultured cyanophage]8HDR_2 Chain 2, pam3 tube protein [uncultured cyanophage]8HDR_Y Chain Y, pam3 tube protein [uncultured cyanophage]8HDR_Z Chain Z, pam3 tube protein [uncultured cyanophage]8HDR_m Chain m, pam3 tube protein [uncultured cyanophage]8HDR_n Chain n, pam3 tube protein [uncultured cyanophage]8HDR_o Chain o, pam3 tube protein [uncultured cyanophage]8HDR_p Chain p, pam3 tube protein [uncultured cyanophage]8HDR_q Chain q, pam3 tube protein [uncultur
MAMKAYSMLNVTATLDGRRVIGLMDGDDAITTSPGVDVGTMLVGADGSWLFSQTADKSATVVIKLKPNSPTHRQLTEKWMAQRAGRLVGFPFDFIDSASNEGGTGAEFFIQKAPDDSKGNNAVVREWTIVTGEWTPTIPTLL